MLLYRQEIVSCKVVDAIVTHKSSMVHGLTEEAVGIGGVLSGDMLVSSNAESGVAGRIFIVVSYVSGLSGGGSYRTPRSVKCVGRNVWRLTIQKPIY